MSEIAARLGANLARLRAHRCPRIDTVVKLRDALKSRPTS